MNTVGLYSPEVADEIQRRVLGGGTQPVRDQQEGIYDEDNHATWYYVKAVETVDPPTGKPTDGEGTGYKKFKAAVCKLTSDGTNHDREDVENEDLEIDCILRDPNSFIAKNDYFWVREIEGEYVPVGPLRNEVEGVLKTSLGAGAHTTSSGATGVLYHPNDEGDTVLTTHEISVINNGAFISADAKCYFRAKRVNGKWVPSYLDCEPLDSVDPDSGDPDIL